MARAKGHTIQVCDHPTSFILSRPLPYGLGGVLAPELRPDAHVQPGRIYISVAARRRDKERAGDGAEVLVGVRYIVGSVEVTRGRGG